MRQVEVLRRLRLDEAARWLELHPFDLVRLLALHDQLAPDLRLDGDDVETVRRLGGLETWWEDAPKPEPGESPARSLLRALVAKILVRSLVEPNATRADNLFRGLGPDAQLLLRRAVNLLIRERYLVSRMSAEGLLVSVRAGCEDDLRAFAHRGIGPLAAAAERV